MKTGDLVDVTAGRETLTGILVALDEISVTIITGDGSWWSVSPPVVVPSCAGISTARNARYAAEQARARGLRSI